MMEVSQAVPPAVDFKDKIKVNGIISQTKLTEKKSDEMAKLPEKSEVLAKIKDVSTPSTVNGNVDLEDIFVDDIDDPDLLNTEGINGGEGGTDDIDILAEEFLNDIEGYEVDGKVLEDALLEEEKAEEELKKAENVLEKTEHELKKFEDVLNKSEDVFQKIEDVLQKIEDVSEKPEDLLKKTEDVLKKPEDMLKKNEDVLKKTEVVSEKVGDLLKKTEHILRKTEDADVEEQKAENLDSNNEKNNEKLSVENLDNEEESKETEAEVEKKTDRDEETANLSAEIADVEEEEHSFEHAENIEEPTRKLSTEKIDQNDSLPETTDANSNSAVESRLEKAPCSRESKTEKAATNRKDRKSEDSEKVVDGEPSCTANIEKNIEIGEVLSENKDKDSQDEQHDKALKLSDCDIINLDSPMAVEDKEEKQETNVSNLTQRKSVDLSALVEDKLIQNKRRRESRTGRRSRTSRESRESRETREEKQQKEKTEHTEVNESPQPKRRKSSPKNDLKEDDILLLEEKLEMEEEKETTPSKDNKEKKKDKTIQEPNFDDKDDDVMLVDDKLDIEEEEIEQILAKEKESEDELKPKIASQEKKLNENESDDDDVVFLEEKKIETASDSKKTTSKNVRKEEDKKEELKKCEDITKEVQKVKEVKTSGINPAQDKSGNDSDDDVVLLDDDVEETEAKNIKQKEDSKNSKTDSTATKSESLKKQSSSDEKAKDKTVTANEIKKNIDAMEDDDDVVLLEVDDEKSTKKDEPKKFEETNDKVSKEENKEKKTEVSKEENKEKKTKKEELEEVFSFDTSISAKVDKKVTEVEDDDEVVFMEEIKSTEKEKNKDLKDKVTSAPSTRSSSRKSSKDVDETDQSKPRAISPDNSDNAQDKFPEKSEEDTANTDGDNNLLEEGKPPEICSNDEASDLENSSEPLSKQIKVGDDETSQSSITLETDGVKVEGVDRKSLKRSISGDSLSQESKKLKADTTEAAELKKETDELLIPRPPSTKPVDLNLDFLKRFKKSISKMTKADLEELVLQKIVEAIVHKSEFSEMRDLIEKQEKVIGMHRTKIAEITKQFRDLEMVHNRVVKDIETKNQQFIMPVKITRAVGLQVLIPKRIEQNGGSKTSSTASERTAAPPPPPSPTISNTIEIAKRKCTQKITPLRPDTAQSPMNRSFPPSIAQNGPSNSSGTSSPQQPSTTSAPHSKPLQKILPRMPAAPVTPQQNANTTQTVPAQYIIQQQPSFNALTQAVQAVRKSTNSLRSAPQQPTVTRPPASQSSPDRPRVPPMILKKSGTNGQVLTVASPTNVTVTPVATPPTPAPPNKSFIDLTDEDDGRPQQQVNSLPALVAIPAAAQPATRVTYVVNKPNTTPQRVTVTQNSTNMTRMPAIRARTPYAAASKQAAVQQQQQQPVAPTQSGPRMPAATTVRRSHPAPLPKSPPALSNPAWKTPPPRPAIRINNIDSGIVISWTMDEMTDQHAEVTSYQIYAYQETSAPPQVEAWRHVGDVKAMLLPMAVTLTQFQEGQRYYFAVRAVDMHSRCGPFSIPKTWS